ncbi:MAG: biopolymer transporter [Desulfobacteraceae bacterium]|nr:biopolymer transporter [Desulfobacteraceae bacterium]
MIRIKGYAAALLFAMLVFCHGVCAQDMRDMTIRARQIQNELMEKAVSEKKAADQAAKASRERIINDKNALRKAIEELKAENRRLSASVKTLEAQSRSLEEQEGKLDSGLSQMDKMMHELAGVVRVSAKDTGSLIEQSPRNALVGQDTDFLKSIAGQIRFPAMDDIRRMTTLLINEIQVSGQVEVTRGAIVNRKGFRVEAQILFLGNFTSAYRIDGQTGFLSYSPSGRKLFALSRLPAGRIQKQLAQYMDGKSESVPIDISRGGALRQLTNTSSLWEQIRNAGLIVWPILAIFVLASVLIAERIIFLVRKRLDSDGFIQKIETLAATRLWDECVQLCRRYKSKPVARVVTAGLNCRRMGREDMENALQEAILRQIPVLERFLSTLEILAAIAPLLGLLGTVTGMIETFQVITHHGTGDPRMMSGGISEALVTTMLGLSVAIPIMLAHSLLSRAVENHIGQMEEKAVAFVNIVEKTRCN